tara:strand:- start:246 stop:530 length:285 start_codon:yes stop_codon:yes gene_type:complete
MAHRPSLPADPMLSFPGRDHTAKHKLRWVARWDKVDARVARISCVAPKTPKTPEVPEGATAPCPSVRLEREAARLDAYAPAHAAADTAVRCIKF